MITKGRSILAGFAAWCVAAVDQASAVTITDIQIQSNFNGATGAGQSAPIAAAAFNFSLQPQLISIESVSITMTVIDGDTGLGPNGINETPYPPPGDGTQFGDDDFDVNSLNLRLDGIDLGQGLLLNGFNNYDPNFPLAQSDYVTLTITGTPTNMSALLTALQDGMLVATVFDTTGTPQSNGFRIPNMNLAGNQQIFTTLSITGVAVPEPGTIALMIVGVPVLAFAAALVRRRRRS